MNFKPGDFLKRIFFAATAATLLIAAPALAADDVMASYLGNTVVSTGGMTESHTHYKADHSFDLVGSMMGMSKTFAGTGRSRTASSAVPMSANNRPACPPIRSARRGRRTKSAIAGP
ncbi:MAG: hypothetical protein WDM81_03875 [Rhizomicrobium sp.]